MKMKLVGILVALIVLSITSITNADTAENEIEIYGYGPGIEEAFAFSMRHISDANEGPDAHDGSAPPPPVPGNPAYVEIFSNPYGTTLFQDARNKESTLPVDISAILKNADDINCALYFDVINGYEHRNLTVQEIDPCNPNDSNNTNPIEEIRSLPIGFGMYEYSIGFLEQDVVRMFRIGVYRKFAGDLTENGVVDLNDLEVFTDQWLDATIAGENHLVSDINHDRVTDFDDFAAFAETWLKEEE